MICRIVTSGALLAAALVLCGRAGAEAPTPSDPLGMAPPGSLPGTFPTSVTAANVNAAPIAGSVLGGSGSNNLLVSFPASGPIKWTEARHNEGDISLNIGPFDPNDPSYFPPTMHVENYAPLQPDPFANTVLAWRVNQQTGAALATPRHNGVNNGDTFGGNPVGTIQGVAYFNQTGAQGWGYNMVTGELGNGGGGATDLQMGVAGSDGGQGEAVFNTAVAYFPYEQGWTGAWVNGSGVDFDGTTPLDGPGTFAAGTPELDPSTTVNWTGGVATVTLPGVNALTDGMLFVAPTHDDNATNIAAGFPTASGWKVSVREDNDTDTTGATLVPLSGNGSQNAFQFLYVPYTAGNLIGGRIDGDTGNSLQSAGDVFFDVVRTAAGNYQVSIYADSSGTTKLTGNDGMLVLSVAQSVPGNPNTADRKFMSYQYNGTDFIVQSRELVATGQPIPPSQNQFGNDLALRDTDFYFAWVDFDNPLQPGPTADFDDDGDVDGDDFLAWRRGFGENASADSDNDGDSDGADFLAWQRQFGTGVGAPAAAVPEPAAIVLALAGAAAVCRVTRRRV